MNRQNVRAGPGALATPVCPSAALKRRREIAPQRHMFRLTAGPFSLMYMGCADVAQWIEHCPPEARAGSSNLFIRAIFQEPCHQGMALFFIDSRQPLPARLSRGTTEKTADGNFSPAPGPAATPERRPLSVSAPASFSFPYSARR